MEISISVWFLFICNIFYQSVQYFWCQGLLRFILKLPVQKKSYCWSIFCLCFQITIWRSLEDVLKTSWSKHVFTQLFFFVIGLKDNFRTYCLRQVTKEVCIGKTFSRCIDDVFKMSWSREIRLILKHVFKKYLRNTTQNE